MDIDNAITNAVTRLAPGIDSNRASAIIAYHGAINKLRSQLKQAPLSPQGRNATEAMVRHYSARIDALSREFA